MTRTSVSSGGPWESTFGYCRAVRVGNTIAVSGSTAARPDGTIAGPGDAYAQAKAALATIRQALAGLGASMSHVVRTRTFVVDMDDSEAVGRAHGEEFVGIRPAATMVEVSRLIHPEMLVEIEADAIVGNHTS
jgi:enamine deaminase RidA (YjgF/YER057c/UK114 family)